LEYNFMTNEITQLTSLTDDSVRGLSLSPDGQYIVLAGGGCIRFDE
jgi:hypothetical protein